MRCPKKTVREFEYRPNSLQTGLLFLLVLSASPLCIYVALNADGGAKVRGLQLTAMQVRIMMGIVATLSPLGAVLLGWAFVDSLIYTRRIAFTTGSIILPKPSRSGVSHEEIELPFATINSVTVAPFIGKMLVLRIVHTSGVISIPSNMLANRGDFEAIGELLSAAVAEASQ